MVAVVIMSMLTEMWHQADLCNSFCWLLLFVIDFGVCLTCEWSGLVQCIHALTSVWSGKCQGQPCSILQSTVWSI